MQEPWITLSGYKFLVKVECIIFASWELNTITSAINKVLCEKKKKKKQKKKKKKTKKKTFLAYVKSFNFASEELKSRTRAGQVKCRV